MQGVEVRAGQLLPQWASVNRVVLDLFKHYEPAFNVKRIATGLDLDPVVPLTWGDRALLKRGLGGILGHAVKHSSPGGLVVVRTTLDGDWVTLTVGENGVVEDNDHASRLLEQPMQSPGEELALAQQIISAHGGQIGVETSPGVGSCCVVRLPGVAMENARLSEELEQSRKGGRDLLATLSYELRTPLHAIMGYSDLLGDGTFGALSVDQLDTVKRIDDGARELLNLVEGAIDARSNDEDVRFASACIELPERLHGFCQLAIEALECDNCLAFIWQPACDAFVPVAAAGVAAGGDDWFATTRLAPSKVAGLLSRDNGPGAVVLMDPRELLPESVARRLRLHACVLLPVRRGKNLMGIMLLGYARRTCVFSADHAHFAEGIGDLAALAVENSVLSEQIDQTARIMTEFVSSMSHHSRIPLNVIIGYTDLLHEGEFGALTDQQKTVTKRLRSSGRELLDVINRNLAPNETALRQYDA